MFLLLEADTALPRFWDGRYASLPSTIPKSETMRQARGKAEECRRRALTNLLAATLSLGLLH